MTNKTSAFVRRLNPENLEILWALADSREPNWFRDALVNPKFFFTLRSNRVDIYSGGALIFSVKFRKNMAIPQTHVKYLVREEQGYIALLGKKFDYEPRERMQIEYDSSATLDQILKASSYYAQVEGAGVLKAIIKDVGAIDIEVSFGQSDELPIDTLPLEVDERSKLLEEAKLKSRRQDRIDIVSINRNKLKGRGYSIVFWEAKHYSNKEIFLPLDEPKVIEQIRRYEKQLVDRKERLVEPYRSVCDFHAEIEAMRMKLGASNASSVRANLMRTIASGDERIQVDEKPRLFVFGFDKRQKLGPWKDAKETLDGHLGGPGRVRGTGNPEDADLSTQ